MPDWYIEDGRADRGPHTGTELKRLAAAGAIDAATPIRRDDLASAVPAARVRGLLPSPPGAPSVAAPPTARPEPRTSAPARVDDAGADGDAVAAASRDASASPHGRAASDLAAAIGLAPGQALFAGEAPSAAAEPTAIPAAAPPFDPFPGRRVARSDARAAPARPPRGVALVQPDWRRLWPLAALILAVGWIGGGVIDLGRAFHPGAVWPVLFLAAASVPLAWLAFLAWLRPRSLALGQACGVAAFTAIGGLVSLLGLQWVAFNSVGVRTYGRLGLIKVVLVLIAVAYALTGSDNILLRFVGFVFGVGLMEEMTKLLPLAWLIHQSVHRRLGLHAFIALGFASGLGFGIGEALLQYNPWSGAGMTSFGLNLVRWCACVPSHGVYTAISAVFLWKLGDRIAHAEGFWGKAGVLAIAAGAMALLHGMYDTVCSVGAVAALTVEAASLPLLAWIVARATAGEEDPPAAATADPRAVALRRPLVVGGAFAALALAITLAALATEPSRGETRSRVVAATARPWTRAYAHARAVRAEPPSPLAAVFTLGATDADGEPHLVGAWLNTAREPLVHVVLRVHPADEPEDVADLEPFDLAPGTFHRVGQDEWPFDPGEVVEATWRGQATPVVFRIPTEASGDGD